MWTAARVFDKRADEALGWVETHYYDLVVGINSRALVFTLVSFLPFVDLADMLLALLWNSLHHTNIILVYLIYLS